MSEREWRPIETAPKDGTTVLIGWGDQVRAAWWDPELESEWDHEADDSVYIGGWTDGRFEDHRYETWPHYPATHWMPLPAPPGAPSGGAA